MQGHSDMKSVRLQIHATDQIVYAFCLTIGFLGVVCIKNMQVVSEAKKRHLLPNHFDTI